jgi:hypothetical protein
MRRALISSPTMLSSIRIECPASTRDGITTYSARGTLAVQFSQIEGYRWLGGVAIRGACDRAATGAIDDAEFRDLVLKATILSVRARR